MNNPKYHWPAAARFSLNKTIAELHGWSNIFEIGNSLMGTPPEGNYSVRGQAMVPDWAGDWSQCGPLMTKYKCYPVRSVNDSVVEAQAFNHSAFAVSTLTYRFPDEDTAIRWVICESVIKYLNFIKENTNEKVHANC